MLQIIFSISAGDHLLVADLELEVLHATSGYDEIIPCRPTAPDLQVTISVIGDSVSLQKGENFHSLRINEEWLSPNVGVSFF